MHLHYKRFLIFLSQKITKHFEQKLNILVAHIGFKLIFFIYDGDIFNC